MMINNDDTVGGYKITRERIATHLVFSASQYYISHCSIKDLIRMIDYMFSNKERFNKAIWRARFNTQHSTELTLGDALHEFASYFFSDGTEFYYLLEKFRKSQ